MRIYFEHTRQGADNKWYKMIGGHGGSVIKIELQGTHNL
jgi:hypothetical protein